MKKNNVVRNFALGFLLVVGIWILCCIKLIQTVFKEKKGKLKSLGYEKRDAGSGYEKWDFGLILTIVLLLVVLLLAWGQQSFKEDELKFSIMVAVVLFFEFFIFGSRCYWMRGCRKRGWKITENPAAFELERVTAASYVVLSLWAIPHVAYQYAVCHFPQVASYLEFLQIDPGTGIVNFFASLATLTPLVTVVGSGYGQLSAERDGSVIYWFRRRYPCCPCR